MNLDSLRSLQQRLRVASGADRELDFAIIDALFPPDEWPMQVRHDATFLYTTYPDGLGACVGLMTATLPVVKFYEISVYLDDEPGFYASIETSEEGTGHVAKSRVSPSFAFLDAIFSAVISQLEAQQTETTG